MHLFLCVFDYFLRDLNIILFYIKNFVEANKIA